MHLLATYSLFLLPEPASLRGASLSESDLGLSLVADGPALYRPRHPERSAFYKILDQHFDRYVSVHEERFEPKSGPLRSVVRPVVEAFLDCGRPNNGLLAPGGEFIALPSIDAAVLTEVFRKLVLDGLHEVQRLSDHFRESLRCWEHSGFSVFCGEPISSGDQEKLERMARYITRPKVAIGSVQITPEGQVLVSTPLDPRTGESIKILEPIEWVHAITSQIPDAGQHLVLYFGAYANRGRGKYRQTKDDTTTAPALIDHPDDTESAFANSRRKSWARLLRKILEVDPLICARCGVAMKVISVITDPTTIDKILAHLQSGKGHDPFEARAPPSGLAQTG